MRASDLNSIDIRPLDAVLHIADWRAVLGEF